MPGEESLIAPNWVPWAERLADYKALQAELEAQAAAEAAEAEENDDVEDDEDDESEEASAELNEEIESEEVADESAATLAPEGVDAENNSDDAGARVPRFLRRRLGRLKHKK
jgi:hypothetical protein